MYAGIGTLFGMMILRQGHLTCLYHLYDFPILFRFFCWKLNLIEIMIEMFDNGFFLLMFRIKTTKFQVIVQNDDQVEVSFSRQWDPSLKGKLVPLNIDKRSPSTIVYNHCHMIH